MSGSQHEKNSERVARGLKASIHNPRVSPEAKAHAEERLHEMGYEIEPDKDSGVGSASQTSKRPGRKSRRGGAVRKAAKSGGSPPEQEAHPEVHEVAEEPKEHEEEPAQEGEVESRKPTPAHSKHEARVLGGYKATLSSVSEEAKRHARQVLEEHEAI
ncbi:hypothetical protein JOM56_004085 [Amanita muscaria]